MMQRAYARLHQTRTGFPTPAYVSNVSCDSKDGVRAGIEAKRNLVTSRQRRVINYLQTDGQTGLTAGFPSVDDMHKKVVLRPALAVGLL